MKVQQTFGVVALLAAFTQARDVEEWPACNTFVPCADGTYLNQLACNCFSTMQCEIWCGEESGLLPTDGCSCVSKDKIRSFYPEWATDEDIKTSERLGMANMFPTPEPDRQTDGDDRPDSDDSDNEMEEKVDRVIDAAKEVEDATNNLFDLDSADRLEVAKSLGSLFVATYVLNF